MKKQTFFLASLFFLLLCFFPLYTLADSFFVMEPPEASVAGSVEADKKWKILFKKGLKRADVLVTKNNRLQNPVYIDYTVQCLQSTTEKTLLTWGETPQKAYKKWMKACGFANASAEIAKQQAIEKKQAVQKKLTRFEDLEIPENVKKSITNPQMWDASTKTLLGNQQQIYHSLEAHKREDFDILGITELIGVGLSNYTGSDKNRIANFSHAAKKIDGQIVHPGESFSTLKTIAPFTKENGYQVGKVIVDGKIEEEIGGGVCQTVTTLFRAWNNAGLEITKTQPHSKVISYYGGIGLDATLYEGANYESSVDLLLKNNSENSVLIQSVIENGYQIILLYGTKDRKTTLTQAAFEETETKIKAVWKRTVEMLKTGEKTEKIFTQAQKKPEK